MDNKTGPVIVTTTYGTFAGYIHCSSDAELQYREPYIWLTTGIADVTGQRISRRDVIRITELEQAHP